MKEIKEIIKKNQSALASLDLPYIYAHCYIALHVHFKNQSGYKVVDLDEAGTGDSDTGDSDTGDSDTKTAIPETAIPETAIPETVSRRDGDAVKIPDN